MQRVNISTNVGNLFKGKFFNHRDVIWLGCQIEVIVIIEPETNGGIIRPGVGFVNEN